MKVKCPKCRQEQEIAEALVCSEVRCSFCAERFFADERTLPGEYKIIALRGKANSGDVCAQYEIGRCHEEGDGVRENLAVAIEWYRKAAEQGHADAQYSLGRLYEEGLGVAVDSEEALRWLRKAADQGHVRAQLDIGDCYLDGFGVPEDKVEAVRWFRMAAEQGEEDSRHAWNCLGECYLNGDGVEKNLQEAVRLFKLSAEMDALQGQYNLAKCYASGTGVDKDYKAAFYWFLRASENDGDAQYEVAECYYRGLGVERNAAEAAKWYLKAAKKVQYDARFMLGQLYDKGEGVPKDESKAAYWYRRCMVDNVVAANALGEHYYEGRGVEQNYGEAVKLFRCSAEDGGFAAAQCNLAECYENGHGVAKDYAEAEKWYRKAAEQGNVKAQVALARMYEDGRGVVENKCEAIKWYVKAAEQGNNCAQCNLGLAYEYGRGAPVDLHEAFKWYKKSAENGWARGKYRLGLCFENGNGVDKDATKACEWYRKAAADGNEDAKKRLAQIEREKSIVEIPIKVDAPIGDLNAKKDGAALVNFKGDGVEVVQEPKRRKKMKKPTERKAYDEMNDVASEVFLEEYELDVVDMSCCDGYLYALELSPDADEESVIAASNELFHRIGILEENRDLEIEEETEYCTVHQNEHSGKYFVIFNHPFVIDAETTGEVTGDTVREFVEATRKRIAESEAREDDEFSEWDNDEEPEIIECQDAKRRDELELVVGRVLGKHRIYAMIGEINPYCYNARVEAAASEEKTIVRAFNDLFHKLGVLPNGRNLNVGEFGDYCEIYKENDAYYAPFNDPVVVGIGNTDQRHRYILREVRRSNGR